MPTHRPSRHDLFEILVREHADTLAAYLRALLGRDASVEDLFQEAMLVAWRRLDEYDRSRPFAAWLRGIARNLAMERARKRKAAPLTIDPQTIDHIDRRFDALARLPGDTLTQRTERLLDCLDRLPAPMREAIDLVYSRSLSLDAAAAATGASKEAMTKRVQRGRRLVAECMGLGEAAA